MVLFDYTPNATQFQAIETSAACQPDRTKPVLRDFVISLHMDMSRLITITGLEKEPIRS